MGINIILPNINAATPEQQIAQLKSYLYQMAEQLNWAFSTLENTTTGGNATSVVVDDSEVSTEEEAQNTFNSIKSLIIKSADIVKAYSEEIDNLLNLSGTYVAEATFPSGSATFVQETNAKTSANSENIETIFKNLQTITTSMEGFEKRVVDVTANIKSGHLYDDDDGIPVFGVEVGQTNTVDGVKTFNKFARFTSDRLSFYDKNDNEVAYISDYKLYITHAIISGSFTLGGFVETVDQSNGSIVKKWVGWGAVSR